MTELTDELRRQLVECFQMPSVQTMVSRKSSITNAFVVAVIPVIEPTCEEIADAIHLLGMEPTDLRCAYCGDRFTEWDHLRPLVDKRRPTGYISEIANLVPSCGKCNQSKGNKPWKKWMLSDARLSPTGRGVAGGAERVARLERYEAWREPTKIDFVAIIGEQTWSHYWSLCETVISDLQKHQVVADALKARIVEAIQSR